MSWTKRQLCDQAFRKAGLAALVFALTPEQWESALRDLDAMMAEWAGLGVNLGYPLALGADDSDLGQDSFLPVFAIAPAYNNLAPRIAGDFGKTVSASTLKAAKDGWDIILARSALPPPNQFPSTLPVGAGNRLSRMRTYFPRPDLSPIRDVQGGNLTLGD